MVYLKLKKTEYKTVHGNYMEELHGIANHVYLRTIEL